MINSIAKLCFLLPAYNISRAVEYPLAMPCSVTLSLTNECYSQCKTCNIWLKHKSSPKTVKNELTTKEYNKILADIGKTPLWFTITGGEPFLREDIDQIIMFVQKYNRPKYINIATSGIYPSRILNKVDSILSNLNKTILFTVNVSVDEIDLYYEKIRGVKNGYRQVERTIKGLHDLKKKYNNLVIGVNCVLSSYNYRRYIKIINHIQDTLNPDSLVSEMGSKRKAILFNEDISLSKEDSERLINFIKIKKLQKKNAFITAIFRKKFYSLVLEHIKYNKKILNCYAGYASCEISAYGEVWNCSVRAESFGNLRDYNYNFKRVWKTPRTKDIRRNIKNCFCNAANPNYTNILCNFKI